MPQAPAVAVPGPSDRDRRSFLSQDVQRLQLAPTIGMAESKQGTEGKTCS